MSTDTVRARAEQLAKDLEGCIEGEQYDVATWNPEAALELILSFAEEIKREERARLVCDCGEKFTLCTSCAVCDWQAAHPKCEDCCPPAGSRRGE